MHLSRITGRTRPEAGGISVLFDARNEPRVEKLSDPLKRLSLMVVGWERRISGQALPPLRWKGYSGIWTLVFCHRKQPQ